MPIGRSLSTSLVVLVVLVMLMGAVGCGDDVVEIPIHEMVGHYTEAQPNLAYSGLVHFDIRPDNTVAYKAEDSCGEYVSEASYAWESVDEDTILITNLSGGWIDGTYKIRVTPGPVCNELFFEHFTADVSLYTYKVYLGDLCLSPSYGQCFTEWCSAPPDPC
jgi:hypothetical protein